MKWLLGCAVLLLGIGLSLGIFFVLSVKQTTVAQQKAPPAKEPVSLGGVKWPVRVAQEVFNGPPQFSEATRMFIQVAQGVPVSKLVNLSIFGDFRPGFTFDEAVTRYGQPSRVRTDKKGRAAIYESPNARIEVEHNVYDSGWFAEYHRKSVYAYVKPENTCTATTAILDPTVSALVPENLSAELHVTDAERNEQHVFLLVVNGCVKTINWLSINP